MTLENRLTVDPVRLGASSKSYFSSFFDRISGPSSAYGSSDSTTPSSFIPVQQARPASQHLSPLRRICRRRAWTSNRCQAWLSLIAIATGAYYYYESYLIAANSFVLSRKAYEIGLWENCQDRSDISNTSTCHKYANMTFDSIARRSLNLSLNPVSTLPRSAPEFMPWHSAYLLNGVTLCALIYVYAIKMTPITTKRQPISETLLYSAFVVVAVTFLLYFHPLFPSNGTFLAQQWRFTIKGMLCFHFAFAWYRLLSSRRCPLPILRGISPWQTCSLFTMLADLVFFALSALLIVNIYLNMNDSAESMALSSGVSKMESMMVRLKGLLVLHLPVLTLLYVIAMSLRVWMWEAGGSETEVQGRERKGDTAESGHSDSAGPWKMVRFEIEAQEAMLARRFYQSLLVECFFTARMWVGGRQRGDRKKGD